MNFNLEEWLLYLEKRNSSAIKLGLDRIFLVAKKLDVLRFRVPVITVGGTNGKGSMVAALACVYNAQGYKVAKYTSPHLLHFEERITINNICISKKRLCELFIIIEEAREKIELTFFEVATLAALLHFKYESPDLIILEVGMGGRLDAVNIIDPALAIVTTVDFDHEEHLGDTLEKIAYEKAGIFRTNTPCLYADLNPPKAIIEQAKAIGARLFCYNKDYFDTQINFKHLYPETTAAVNFSVSLLQSYLPVSRQALNVGLQMQRISGRLELVYHDCNLLFDVAHNAQSVIRLRKFIEDNFADCNIYAVFSALSDKNIKALISPLADLVHKWHVGMLPTNRAASKEQLTEVFNSLGLQLEKIYTSPILAFNDAKHKASPADVIVTYGSFFTVANVMDNNWETA